jgi:lysyl-tRNA synthetase class 2
LFDNSRLSEGRTADFTNAIDLGDLIEVTGTMGASKSGTPSLLVDRWRLTGKCLRPLP